MTCLIVGSNDFINISTVTVMITYIDTTHSKIQSECVCMLADQNFLYIRIRLTPMMVSLISMLLEA